MRKILFIGVWLIAMTVVTGCSSHRYSKPIETVDMTIIPEQQCK